MAKQAREIWRRRTYQRWFAEACTDIEIVGRHHLNSLREQPAAIIVANHQSHLDTVIINATLPAHVRRSTFYGAAQDRWFVRGKKKKSLKPWYQSFVMGNFPIMRGGGSAALTYASWLLEHRQHVMLFPEGTRAMGNDLGKFRHGATLLALEHDVPIYPVYLGGMQALRKKTQREVKPGPVYVEYLQPIRFSSGSDVAAATHLIQKRMSRVHASFSLKSSTGLWQPRGVVVDGKQVASAA